MVSEQRARVSSSSNWESAWASSSLPLKDSPQRGTSCEWRPILLHVTRAGGIHTTIPRWAGMFLLMTSLGVGQGLTGESTTTLVSSRNDPRPIIAKQRVAWVIIDTLGPQVVIGEAFSAGLATLKDRPAELGSHWDGFGKRAGIERGGWSESPMEAGLGSHPKRRQDLPLDAHSLLQSHFSRS